MNLTPDLSQIHTQRGRLDDSVLGERFKGDFDCGEGFAFPDELPNLFFLYNNHVSFTRVSGAEKLGAMAPLTDTLKPLTSRLHEKAMAVAVAGKGNTFFPSTPCPKRPPDPRKRS